MKAYSLDLRQKIVARYDAGGISQRGLAQQFGVALSLIEKLLKQRRETDSIAPKARPTQTPLKLSPAQLQVLQALVEANQDATLAELRQLLARQTGVLIGRSTVDRMLTKLGLSRKKKPCIPTPKQVTVSNGCVMPTGRWFEASWPNNSSLLMNRGLTWP